MLSAKYLYAFAASTGALIWKAQTGGAVTSSPDKVGNTVYVGSGNGKLDAWFIAFAPAEAPQVAVAVVVERTDQYGGQVAAPIARDVMQAVLNAAS